MENSQTCFWIIFAILAFLMIYCDRKYFLLRDTSVAQIRPYSFARVQLAWWTVIVLSAFITIIIMKDGAIPTLDTSTLILLGISAGTTATARLIDLSDQSNPAIIRNQNSNGSTFFLDILSDENGINIHRLQTVLFNITFGVWFIFEFIRQVVQIPNCPVCSGTAANAAACLICKTNFIDHIIPVITDRNLVLLGLSSATYAALKTTENKTSIEQPTSGDQKDLVADEANNKYNPAQG